MQLACWGTLGLLLLNKLIKTASYPLLYSLSAYPNDEEKRVKGANKAAVDVTRLVYHATSFTAGYLILKNTPFLPKHLGGHSEDTKFCFENYPFVNYDYPYLKEYALLCLAFPFADFV